MGYIKEVVDKIGPESRQIAREKVSGLLGVLPVNFEQIFNSIIGMMEEDVAGVCKDFRHQGKKSLYFSVPVLINVYAQLSIFRYISFS